MLLAIIGWLAFLCGVAVFALVAFVRHEHEIEADRRYALAGEQRSVARAAATLAKNLSGGSIPATSPTSLASTASTASPPSAATPSDFGVSVLRTRSLELIARTPPEPGARLQSERTLQAEWTRLAAGIDSLQGEWSRIVDLRSELEALRGASEALRESSERVADALSGRDGGMLGEAEALTLAARRFAEVVGRASLAEPAPLDRATAGNHPLAHLHAHVDAYTNVVVHTHTDTDMVAHADFDAHVDGPGYTDALPDAVRDLRQPDRAP